MATRRLRTNPAGRTSYLLLHWATEIAKKMLDTDYDAENVLSAAFGTANRMLEEKKYRLPGRVTLTPAGKAREQELLARLSPSQIEAEYKTVAAQADTRPNATIQENVSLYVRCGTRSAVLDADLANPAHNVWWLARLFVPTDARNKGVARTLITLFLERMLDGGPGWLVVAPGGYDMDEKARTTTYKHLGFKSWTDGMLYLPFNGATGKPPMPPDNLFSRNNYSATGGGGGDDKGGYGGDDGEDGDAAQLRLLESYLNEIINRHENAHNPHLATLLEEVQQVLAEINVMASMPRLGTLTFVPRHIQIYAAAELKELDTNKDLPDDVRATAPFLAMVLKFLHKIRPAVTYPKTLKTPTTVPELILHTLAPAFLVIVGSSALALEWIKVPVNRNSIAGTVESLGRSYKVTFDMYEKTGVGYNLLAVLGALRSALASNVAPPAGVLQAVIEQLRDIHKERGSDRAGEQRFFNLLLDTATATLSELDQ